jgi:hypothetical protein
VAVAVRLAAARSSAGLFSLVGGCGRAARFGFAPRAHVATRRERACAGQGWLFAPRAHVATRRERACAGQSWRTRGARCPVHARPHLVSGDGHLAIALARFDDALAEARTFLAAS